MRNTLTNDIRLAEEKGASRESVPSFVVVEDAHVVSAWNTYEEAMREGYRLLGQEPFFIREFCPDEVGPIRSRD